MKQQRVDDRQESPGTDPRAVRPRLEPGATVGDGYVVKTLIGRGATADVYQAVHETTGTRVAIKLAHAHRKDADAAARFKREARIFASVRSSYVAKLFDSDRLPDGTPYMVLELVEGDPLDERLSRGAVPIPYAIAVMTQVLHALEAIHKAGVVHRDVSPANIIVWEDEAGPHIKLVDFGIATSGDDLDTTEPGVIIGTPPYLAPEQIRGEIVDPRTDVYAAGAVLYELLTGEPPFKGETVGEINMQILDGRIKPVRKLRKDCPARLETVVVRAMHLDPALRFDDAAEMREAIDPTDEQAAIPLVRKAPVRALRPTPTPKPRAEKAKPTPVPDGSLRAVLAARSIPEAPKGGKARSNDAHVIPLDRRKEAHAVAPLPSTPAPPDDDHDDVDPVGATLLDRDIERAMGQLESGELDRLAYEAESRHRVSVWDMHESAEDAIEVSSSSRIANAVEDLRLSRAARRAIQKEDESDEPVVLPTSGRSRGLVFAFGSAMALLALAWWVAFVGPDQAQRIALGAYGSAQATMLGWMGDDPRATEPEIAPQAVPEAPPEPVEAPAAVTPPEPAIEAPTAVEPVAVPAPVEAAPEDTTPVSIAPAPAAPEPTVTTSEPERPAVSRTRRNRREAAARQRRAARRAAARAAEAEAPRNAGVTRSPASWGTPTPPRRPGQRTPEGWLPSNPY